MYQTLFGFRERAFTSSLNPRFLFLSAGQQEVLATLRDALVTAPGMTLLTGAAGTGKTMLLRAALEAERQAEHQCALFSNPALTREEFYDVLADQLRLPPVAGSKARFLMAFDRGLAVRQTQGGRTTLLIDDAQSASNEILEELRLLGNLEANTEQLVNVILVGQPELADRLDQPWARPLKQRIASRARVEPLDLAETGAYIAGRCRAAGAEAGAVFTKDAVIAVFSVSQGVPRAINTVCERALHRAARLGQKPVDVGVVEAVARELELAAAPVVSAQHPVVLDLLSPVSREPSGPIGRSSSRPSDAPVSTPAV